MRKIKAELTNTRNFRNMPDVYVPYPLKFALKHDLTCTQTLLFSIIRQYSKLEHEAYTGSIQTLQVMLNISRETVKKELITLNNNNIITKSVDENGRNVYKCAVKVAKDEIFVSYPLKFAVKHGLSPCQTLVYAIIAHYSKLKKGAYTGSVTSLKNALNCSRGTIINTLEILIRRGFILKYKDESANVTFVDGLSHKPGKTADELKLNALWVKENNTLTREKQGRSTRKKGSEATWFNVKKNDSHFENERKYSDKEFNALFDKSWFEDFQE